MASPSVRNHPRMPFTRGWVCSTESRREDGILPFLSVQTNITIVALQKFATAGLDSTPALKRRPRKST